MAEAPEHSTSGHAYGHTLGPHVVGIRVVVRRLLPGQTGVTGGPAFTDVLGVCERWSDGECVVRREDGTAVIIKISQIVSGKPVPPRPSRLTRIPRAEIDAHLSQAGTPVWLGSITQLARRLPEAAEIPEAAGETPDTLTLTAQGHTAHAVRRDDWVVLDRAPSSLSLLAQVVEWGAEQGASVLAITDSAADNLPEDLGLIGR